MTAQCIYIIPHSFSPSLFSHIRFSSLSVFSFHAHGVDLTYFDDRHIYICPAAAAAAAAATYYVYWCRRRIMCFGRRVCVCMRAQNDSECLLCDRPEHRWRCGCARQAGQAKKCRICRPLLVHYQTYTVHPSMHCTAQSASNVSRHYTRHPTLDTRHIDISERTVSTLYII